MRTNPILTNETGNGTGQTSIPAAISTLTTVGVFGGATVTFSISPDNGVTWHLLADGVLTDQGSIIVELPTHYDIKADVTNSTGTTDITATISANV